MRRTSFTGSRSFRVALPGFLLTAWLLMLGLGVAHSDWPTVPALGFWPCLIIAAAFAFVNDTLAHYEWKSSTTNTRTWRS